MPKRKKNISQRRLEIQRGEQPRWMLDYRAAAGVLLIIAAVIWIYYPCLNGGFIWDDNTLITENHLVNASDGLYRIWFTIDAYDYWPMTNSTFWIEWRFWGMKTTAYHVANIMLHIVEVLLIWAILRKLHVPGAFLAAMIFAVHPVNVESVAWIAQRKNLMAMLFFLLAILFYIKTLHLSPLASRPSPLYYWLSLAAFFLAMLSKGSVAVLPILLLLIVWWRRPLTRWDILRTVPFFVIAAGLTTLNIWFQTHGTEEIIRSASFTQRLLGAGGAIWFYLYKTLLPVNLSFVYPQWNILPEKLWWWLPIIATVIVSIVLWCYRQGRMRPVFFAWCVFCVSLIPVLGFADVYFMKYSLVADHYQHIALVGIIALVATGISLWHESMHGAVRWGAFSVAIIVVAVLAFLAHHQSGLYRDAITVYRDTVEKNPECWMVHNNLGNELRKSGQLSEAIQHFQQALKIRPEYAEASNNLGIALAQTGQMPEAFDQFQKALRLNSKYADAYSNYGNALQQSGKLSEAIECYNQALQIQPDLKGVNFNLGAALALAGRYEEAIQNYHRAIKLQPEFAESYINLAMAYEHNGRQAEAVASAKRGLNIARSQGRAKLAAQIENWLSTSPANQSNGQISVPVGK